MSNSLRSRRADHVLQRLDRLSNGRHLAIFAIVSFYRVPDRRICPCAVEKTRTSVHSEIYLR